MGLKDCYVPTKTEKKKRLLRRVRINLEKNYTCVYVDFITGSEKVGCTSVTHICQKVKQPKRAPFGRMEKQNVDSALNSGLSLERERRSDACYEMAASRGYCNESHEPGTKRLTPYEFTYPRCPE